MANLSNSFESEPELIRERDPDADIDDDYEDLEGVRVYTYEGPNHHMSPQAKKRLAEEIRAMERTPSPYNNPIGSGFSPEEVAVERRKQDDFFEYLRKKQREQMED